MTLIAAVPCGKAFAICSDSQETDGPYRCSVQKLSPIDLGTLKVVVAGSGNGGLIDSFIEKASRGLQGENVPSLPDFVSAFENELERFYAADIALCPDQDRSMTLLVAASIPANRECSAWMSRNVTLLPLTKPTLIGWDERLYHSIILRYCYDGMTIAQAILASIYVLVIAEETSQFVKGPFSVAVVRPEGIFMESPDDARLMADRLREYESQMKLLFLLCSDVTTSSMKLKAQLERFSRTITALHDTHVEAEVRRLFTDGFDTREWGYSKFPAGVSISIDDSGHVRVTHGAAEEGRHRIKWNASTERDDVLVDPRKDTPEKP